MRLFSGSDLDKISAEEQARKEAQERQAAPVITQLAAYVRSCWDPAYMARQPITTTMLKAQRQRAGKYEPDKEREILMTGGAMIFMPITEVKCRAAESWVRDILLDSGAPPWELKASPDPEISPDDKVKLEQEFTTTLLELIQATGVAPDTQEMPSLREMYEEGFKRKLDQAAQHKASMMQRKIEDQFAEGGWYKAFNEFVTDLATYPTAFIKGPVIRKQVVLGWGKDETGATTPKVTDKLIPVFERVDPFRIYPEPGVENFEQGYVFEHKPLTRSDLAALIGVPGFDDEAIRLVLNEGPRTSWFTDASELTKNELENKFSSWYRPTALFDCLEFWGKVSGKMLREWGMTPEQITDEAKEYNACVWMIGNYVIKAMLNYDPLGEKPYCGTSMFKVPGAFWGRSIPEALEDVQAACNAAVRSMINNMGIASGPQVEIDVSRLAPGEDITQMHPWKIWQVTSDKSGGGGRAIYFDQPDDNASTHWAIFEKFSKLADEYSGVPSYVSGDISVTGAGRTSSGLSMLMGAAGKSIRQIVSYIDNDIIKPIVTKQHIHNMRFDPDESIKGDAFCNPKGAVNLAVKETAEVRRIEFLNATANPIDFQIMGPEGRASVLREVSKSLQMPEEEVVPSRTKLEMKMKQGQMAQMMEGTGKPSTQLPGPGSATPQLPDGSPAGGAAGNIVSNQQTGAA
jgi:hypothetical protein